MAKLVCELCGGKLVIGTGGVAACEDCGAAYSRERLLELVKGGAAPPEKQSAQELLDRARQAIQEDCCAQAAELCRQALELEPYCGEAWLLRGNALGLGSRLDNARDCLAQALDCYRRAWACAPPEQRPQQADRLGAELMDVVRSVLQLRGLQFMADPDDEAFQDFCQELTGPDSYTGLVARFLGELGAALSPEPFYDLVASVVDTTAITAYADVIWPDYEGYDGHPGVRQWTEYQQRLDRCLTLLDRALELPVGRPVRVELARRQIYFIDCQKAGCSWNHLVEEDGSVRWYRDWTVLPRKLERLDRKRAACMEILSGQGAEQHND